ncbi:MAG: hypothetical protein WBD04_04440 [Candidatus Omnitrophota bacterium]
MPENKHVNFFMIFVVVIVAFLWDIISLKGYFIGGDNFVQFYPWFKAYAASIKSGHFPFWTRFMQSGFPLMAEGQVGGFYPLNILFFLTLPFKYAYNYSIVFHFILAGVSIYFLARKLGASWMGGTLSALIFCFGSSYAGCFYNTITLRTLSWVPLVFLLIEHYFERDKPAFLFLAGLIFGFQLLAGFVQVAIYSGVFYFLYFVYKMKLQRAPLRHMGRFFVFCAIAGLIFLPQFIITSRLVSHSSRQAAALGFALWGSFNPIGLAGAVFPYWAAFTKSDIFLSVFGILFLIASFYMVRRDKKIKPIFFVFIVSFLLALGKYNPLYVIALKLTRFYAFRNPSKFIFFTVMASSVLIGKGFTEFFKPEFLFFRKKAMKIFSIILISCSGLFLITKAVFPIFKEQILSAGRWYAEKMIYGRLHHRYDLETYYRKVVSVYEKVIEGTSFINNIYSWIFVVIALAAVWLILRRGERTFSRFAKGAVLLVIAIDLFAFSFIGTGFRGNIFGPKKLNPTHVKILEHIKNDKGFFRVLPYSIASGKLPNWIMPNANMIYGIDSVAAYSPLVNDAYLRALKPLEVVDDSLGLVPPEKDSLEKKLWLINLLNVKYVVAAENLDKPFLRLILSEEGVNLYEVRDSLPRVFVLKELDVEGIDRRVEMKMIDYTSGLAHFEVDMPYDGFVAFSENNYSGWKVYIDGAEGYILPFYLIQAVKLKKGKHVVKFTYRPMIY